MNARIQLLTPPVPNSPDSPNWPASLLDASTPAQVAAATQQVMLALPGCCNARVLWELASYPTPSIPPTTGDGPEWSGDLLLARAALADGAARMAPGQRPCLAIPLRRSGAVVLLRLDQRSDGQAVLKLASEPLQLADRRMRGALEFDELHGAMARAERSERVQRALFAIADLAGSDRSMPDLLTGIHAIVDTLMYAENFFIVQLDAQRDLMRFLYWVDVEDPVPPGDVSLSSRQGSLTWYLLHDAKPLRGNVQQLAEQVSGPMHFVGTDSFDWMGVPIVRDGVVEGAIVVQSYEAGVVYSAADQALLEFVGSHILDALERKRNHEDLERSVAQRTMELAQANRGLQLEIEERARAERLQAALFKIAQLATVDIDEEQFYREVHAVVYTLISARNFFIALLSADRSQLSYPYAVDETGEIYEARPVSRGLSEYVLRHGTLLVNEQGTLELAARGEVELDSVGSLATCWLGVPLVFGDEAVGVIAVQSYQAATTYGPEEQELLGFVASQIANSLHRRRAARMQQDALAMLEERVQDRTRELRQEISERERAENRLKHEVMHDALTGLPNRSCLRSRLDRLLDRTGGESRGDFALLYLDIDRFKIINDSLGHLAGDEVLKIVAARLQGCVREPDLVARLSGDEFVILLDQAETPETAARVAQRVLDSLDRPVQVAGKLLTPTASIGIVLDDGHYTAGDEVVRDADTALYRAKSLGRNRHVLFDASLQREAIDVLAVEGELREALQQDEFEPYFQPVVNLATGARVGYEALLRWNHPSRGVLGPPHFLQIAEDCGAIEAIDWRMFERSCTLATQLGGDDFLTLNVSPHHLRHEDFDATLLALLARTGLDPHRLLIEVTEGSLLDDPERVRATLGRLRDAGIGAALDDFGTGYSSLSYLDSFPLRMLKIDRSFVVQLGSQGKESSTSILVAILALARALGMSVVAEGIETEAQRSALLALGCEYGQGYLLGRPAPVAHWLALQVDETCAPTPASA